jgi:hypothetical protein
MTSVAERRATAPGDRTDAALECRFLVMRDPPLSDRGAEPLVLRRHCHVAEMVE